MAARIKTAREWGDLKENSEYHDAKNDQAHLETKIKLLRERLARAKVVEATEGSPDVVGFGSTVRVRDEDGTRAALRDRQLADGGAGAGQDLDRVAGRPRAARRLGRREVTQVALPRGTRRYTVAQRRLTRSQ